MRCRIERFLGLVLSVGIMLAGAAPASANPSLSADFTRIMEWMSQELAQGIAFNAGSTFDPPQEVKGYRLQPDISLGVGSVPLDKTKFPVIQAADLREMGAENIFPSRVLFPNLVVHLRAGLPQRFDIAIRGTNMTTPSKYKISPNTTGKGQSNSVGFGVRRHFGSLDDLLYSLGVNYNYVFGKFEYETDFNVTVLGDAFTASSDVKGTMDWNVNSYGINLVVSKAFGAWVPFVGSGYNYATGSVHAHLEVLSETPLIPHIRGSSSRKPEPDQARVIMGLQWSAPWVGLFANGEVKAMGDHAGDSWIIHFGALLPFRIGPKRLAGKHEVRRGRRIKETREPSSRPRKPSRKPDRREKAPRLGTDDTSDDLIFIQ